MKKLVNKLNLKKLFMLHSRGYRVGAKPKEVKTFAKLKGLHCASIIRGLSASQSSSLDLYKNLCEQYLHFREPRYAHTIFNQISQIDAGLWTWFFQLLVNHKMFNTSSVFFADMVSKSVPLNSYDFFCAVKCLHESRASLDSGLRLYALIISYGFHSDVLVLCGLLNFFLRLGAVEFTKCLVDRIIDVRDVSFEDKVKVAADFPAFMGKSLVISWSILVVEYIKTDDLIKARFVFDLICDKDFALWMLMLRGYVNVGNMVAAAILRRRMGFLAEVTSWNLLLRGFWKAGEVESAKTLFWNMADRDSDTFNIMMAGFMDYGYLYAARRVFDEMPNKNLSSWSTMITGYVKYDLPHRTIEVFQLFKEQGLAADVSIISAVCSACSKLGNLDVAMSAIHHYDGPYLYHNVHFIASYIQMYGGCGRIEEALKVFVKASRGDLICFNSMIAAFASHGMGKEAIRLLDDMLIEKIKPEGATFLGVLRACNYGGLFEEGRKFFDQMVEDHEIQPTEEHYACMVEIFARLGDFREASRLGTASSSSVVWQAVLGAFSEDFKVAGANLIKREPSAAQLRDLSNVTKKKGIKGSSMIELGSNVHRFVDFGKWKAGDIPILKMLDEEMGLSLDS